ncbi:hypothetical protein NC652_034021 [Populus alba x Populus x berolinensis]|uniref:Uncharacterized protein n=1 Tax=Populus alba x Populus x berolinensis TaxID=444605 RepID=A0AAD6LV69_9ROSI|nr:hypothetical protein NC652_034015 [Populus alba x Populus x berolinensis]KAJ6880858.1 hypothetical protein NC652_034021 [Populus alba x Populus x berolinensis]KAJ6973731.1 hypothetical protein NC653_033921 [Populus alba x Populus x berolinensis]KAJ6973741.1 hypothetical protein NC653_033929 [Populus alba x Populus x berolinensis]
MATAASASLSLLPPKPQISSKRHENQRRLLLPKLSRRDAALLSFLALVPSAPASAFSVGISGPKDWLKDQKKKTAKYILAPIDASREILRSAYLLLTDSQSEFKEEKLEEVQRLLKSAARDCVPQDRNSFVAFQANTGVEVCTFRLIVKNAASLLDKKDPAKLEAEAILDDLIRSFTSLDGLANEANVQLASDRQKVADALMNTISSLDKFEQGTGDYLFFCKHGDKIDAIRDKGSLLEPSPNTSSSKSIGSCISAIWLLMALPLKRVPVISMLMKRNSSTRTWTSLPLAAQPVSALQPLRTPLH